MPCTARAATVSGVTEEQIRAGQTLVEGLFRVELKRLELGEPRFEWGPEREHIRFPLRVTVKGRSRVVQFDRAPLEDRAWARLSGQVKVFAAEMAHEGSG